MGGLHAFVANPWCIAIRFRDGDVLRRVRCLLSRSGPRRGTGFGMLGGMVLGVLRNHEDRRVSPQLQLTRPEAE